MGGTAAHVPSMVFHSIATFFSSAVTNILAKECNGERICFGSQFKVMSHYSRNIKVVFVLDAAGHMESAVMKQGVTSVCVLVLNWLSQFV